MLAKGSGGRHHSGVSAPDELKRASQRVWGATPAGAEFAPEHEPGTREFFEAVLERRPTWEQQWLPEVVPFHRFEAKRVLEVGCGAGYDAYTLIRARADYTGVDITPENPERVRRHLANYGLEPNVLQADAEQLPFADTSFDVVYSNGVLHHTPSLEKALSEALRVLRPGGEIYFSVYNRHSIVYWLNLGLTEQILRGGWRRYSLETRLRMIEQTTAKELPLVRVFSSRQLRATLRATGFVGVETSVRKLVAEDLPLLPLQWWKKVPQAWLDRVGRRFGWYVWAHATKPAP